MLLLSLPLLAATPDTGTWRKIAVYHVNPLHEGVLPLNMDTADEAGDLFFEMMEVLTVPLACSDPHRSPQSGFNCDNPEAADPTDVVNKLTLTVSGGFSGYAMCNVGRNGTDGLGHPCKDDTYCCFCPDESQYHFPPRGLPCNATVGMSNIRERFGRYHHHHLPRDGLRRRLLQFWRRARLSASPLQDE